MLKIVPGQRNYLEIPIKCAQYLAGLTVVQEIWPETVKMLISFFDADLAAVADRLEDGSIHLNRLRISERISETPCLLEQLGEILDEVFESGFLAVKVISASSPLSLALLPIKRENKVVAVMLVGHDSADPLPRELLNVYLAVAGLVGTTASRLASEVELRRHRQNLQQLVDDRTAELTEANRQLQREIVERKKAEEALRMERDNLIAIFEAMEDVIYIVNGRGELLYGNSAFEKDFGPYAGLHCFERLHGGSGPCTDCVLPDVLAGKTVRREKYFPGMGKTYDLIETPLRNYDEIVKLSIFRDITNLKEAAADRLEMERRLLHSQRLESLGVLAGGIAHDFNNLLTVILGNLDLALCKIPPESSALDNMQTAIDSCHRAVKLIGQMLDYAGKRQFPLKNIDLNGVVQENAELFRTSVERNTELVIATTPGLPWIKADMGQLQQVIMNLIINAAEAIGADTGVIAISTGMLSCDDDYLHSSLIEEKPPSGSYIYLEVSDTGCGMDQETQARLFEPFFTTKFLGRGLGMAAVHGIVRAHGGAILLDSEPGRGSVFRILFPVLDGLESSSLKPVPPEDKSEESRSPGGTILVVDDEADVRTLCMTIVEFLGFHAVGAVDGFDALRVLRERYDEVVVIILDMTMPNLGGVKALQELRKVRPDIPVIISSGYNEQDVAGDFTEEIPSMFIQKPFKVEVLRQAIFQSWKPIGG